MFCELSKSKISKKLKRASEASKHHYLLGFVRSSGSKHCYLLHLRPHLVPSVLPKWPKKGSRIECNMGFRIEERHLALRKKDQSLLGLPGHQMLCVWRSTLRSKKSRICLAYLGIELSVSKRHLAFRKKVQSLLGLPGYRMLCIWRSKSRGAEVPIESLEQSSWE